MASRLAVLKAVPGLLASWESCRFTHFGEPADREQLKPALRTSSLLQPQKIWTKGQTTVSYSIFWVFSLGVLLTSLSKRIGLGKVCRRHSSCCHLTMSYEAYARPQSPQSTAKSKGWCSRPSHCDKATIQKQDWDVEMPWLVGWCFLKISLRVTGSELHITGISKYISVHLFKYCSTNFTINNNKKNLHFLPNQHKIPQNTLQLSYGSPSLYCSFFDLSDNCYRTANYLLLDKCLALANKGFFISHLCNDW